MLNRLLELLREGGTYRIVDLAHRLGATPELVEVMLEDLTRMGYLRLAGGECAESCGACPLAGTCAVGGRGSSSGAGGRVWLWAEGLPPTGDE